MQPWCQSIRGCLGKTPATVAMCLGLVAVVFLCPWASGVGQDEADGPRRLTSDGSFKEKLAWSPDGRSILLTRIHEKKMGLWLLDLESRGMRRLFKHDEAPDFDGYWSPDGKQIVFVFDVLQGTDGKLQINMINADGTDNKVLVENKGFEECPRWSPDGERVAFVSTRHGQQEIYVVDTGGKEIKRLTSEVAADTNPTWSPDGKEIAFASHRHGNWELYVMKADGSDIRRLTHHPSMDYWPVWSPNGKYIAFTSNRSGNYDIWIMKPDGSGLRNLTDHPAQDNHATWSPNGRKIAWVSNRSGSYEIWVMDVE